MKVRRPEFKRQRNARRSWRRRHGMGRVLKDAYNSVHQSLASLRPPMFDCLERHPATNARWGATGVYWDLVASGPSTTRVTSREAASVNYGEPGAASWRGKYG